MALRISRRKRKLETGYHPTFGVFVLPKVRFHVVLLAVEAIANANAIANVNVDTLCVVRKI